MLDVELFVFILCASCTSCASQKCFERGSTGIVPCPAMVDGGYSPDDTEAIYWSFLPEESSDSPKSIIYYFHGVTTQQKSNFKQYDIQNTSLVIYNVTYSAEGTYFYRYIPWFKAHKDGSIKVSEKVPFEPPKKPKVTQCSKDPRSCIVTVTPDTTELNLTCYVEHAKPAVNVSWFGRFSILNRWEEIPATPQLEFVSCNASEKDCFQINNTINSYATVKLPLKCNNLTFKCVANNSELEVAVIKTPSDNVTANTQGVTNPTRFGSDNQTKLSTGSETSNPLIVPLVCMITMNIMMLLALFTTFTLRRYRSQQKLKATHNQHVQSAQETVILKVELY